MALLVGLHQAIKLFYDSVIATKCMSVKQVCNLVDMLATIAVSGNTAALSLTCKLLSRLQSCLLFHIHMRHT